jgi:hypothetical protein
MRGASQLSTEIRKRIARIEVTFEDKEEPARYRLDYCVLIRFINGALRVIGVKDGKALLAELNIDPEKLPALDETSLTGR